MNKLVVQLLIFLGALAAVAELEPDAGELNESLIEKELPKSIEPREITRDRIFLHLSGHSALAHLSMLQLGAGYNFENANLGLYLTSGTGTYGQIRTGETPDTSGILVLEGEERLRPRDNGSVWNFSIIELGWGMSIYSFSSWFPEALVPMVRVYVGTGTFSDNVNSLTLKSLGVGFEGGAKYFVTNRICVMLNYSYRLGELGDGNFKDYLNSLSYDMTTISLGGQVYF